MKCDCVSWCYNTPKKYAARKIPPRVPAVIPVAKNKNSFVHSRQPTMGRDDALWAASCPRNHHSTKLASTANKMRVLPPVAGMPSIGITGKAIIVRANHAPFVSVELNSVCSSQPTTKSDNEMAMPITPPSRRT